MWAATRTGAIGWPACCGRYAAGVCACGALHAANSPTNTNAPTFLVAMRFPLLVMQDTTPNLRRRGCDGCRTPAVRSYGGRCKPDADFSAVCGSACARGADCTRLPANSSGHSSGLRGPQAISCRLCIDRTWLQANRAGLPAGCTALQAHSTGLRAGCTMPWANCTPLQADSSALKAAFEGRRGRLRGHKKDRAP